MSGLTWVCHVCGEERPDDLISVYSEDTSEAYGLRPGTMQRNVRYCKDRPDCAAGAPDVIRRAIMKL